MQKMTDVTLLAVFAAGILSFISPCVLPLVPGYISFMSGVSLEELEKHHRSITLLIRVCMHSIFFGLGFTVIFVGLGATATLLGNFLFSNLIILKRVAGAIIIVFGLHTAGLFRIKFLDYQKSFNFQNKQVRFVNSFVLGLAFSFAWVPCIGPILATILTYAATKDTVIEGILMLIVYSLGLGVPFFLMAIGMGKFIGILDKIKRYFRTVEIVSGSLLVLIGILILTDNLERLTYYFTF
jgi:cytochrome c-type biogenesis protein